MTTFAKRLVVATAVLLACTAATACARPATSATATSAAAGQPTPSLQVHVSVTAGDAPSTSATMICQPEASTEIATALGVQTSTPPTAIWSDHLYACRYVYSSGVMVLSVKELPDDAAATAYYTAAQHSLPSYTPLQVLGQKGFAGPDGSLYVRKDFKVLHVDVAALPDHIGQPPRTRADAAFTVAAVIMSCWAGN